ncbi:MAG: hypothetical protein V3U53_09755 [bacterium]
MAEEILFYIVCPCNCGRAIKVEVYPVPGHEDHIKDVEEVGNNIWQHLVGEYGLEGAIQYLHECD